MLTRFDAEHNERTAEARAAAAAAAQLQAAAEQQLEAGKATIVQVFISRIPVLFVGPSYVLNVHVTELAGQLFDTASSTAASSCKPLL